MSNVLRRLLHRTPERRREPTLGARDVSSMLPAKPVEPANDREPLTPPSDQEIVERQIAALMSVWDTTSLCARREFLARIDQRIMTTHWIRTARDGLAKDVAARRDFAALAPAMAVPAALP
jgi:hypothetical protein